MDSQQPDLDAIAARLLVLNAAVASIAAVSEQQQAILAYFDILSERTISDLLATRASDAVLRLARSQIQDFRKILLSAQTSRTQPPEQS